MQVSLQSGWRCCDISDCRPVVRDRSERSNSTGRRSVYRQGSCYGRPADQQLHGGDRIQYHAGKELAFAFNNRGLGYYTRRDFDHAIADFAQAIRVDPNSAQGYSNRALAHEARGDLGQAIADYNQAIRLDPNYAFSLNGRGNTYIDLKEYDRAIADYTSAIKLEPNNALSFKNRGIAYTAKQDYGRAIADYTEAIRLAPGDPSTLYSCRVFR